MIITLKGANFSANKIGTISSWLISRSLGYGTTYIGPTYVDKNAALEASVTISDGYEIGSAGVSVTMGGTTVTEGITIDGSIITIAIASVTGNVVIKVPTVNTAGGDEPETPTNYTFTINPIPADATVTLTASGYTQSGNSITVPNGTTISWSVNADGYTEQTGTWIANGENKTENVVLTAVGGGDGEAYWISEKLTGNTIGSGTPSSMLSTQWFCITDSTYIGELAGKTVESVAWGSGNKAVSDASIYLYLVNATDTTPSGWELKDTLTGISTEASVISTKELNTPFTVPAGYTIGYRSSIGNVFGGGTVTNEHTRTETFYNSGTATTSSTINIAPIDFKVKQ